MTTKVLMVCLGNICRSPLAEGILKSMVDPSKVKVDSAGTGGYHIGAPPDIRSIEVARKNQIDISGQKARKFIYEDFTLFDHIFVMDHSNYQDVMALAKHQTEKNKVVLLLDNEPVPDPYFGGTDGFEKVFELIHQGCEVIAKKL